MVVQGHGRLTDWRGWFAVLFLGFTSCRLLARAVCRCVAIAPVPVVSIFAGRVFLFFLLMSFSLWCQGRVACVHSTRSSFQNKADLPHSSLQKTRLGTLPPKTDSPQYLHQPKWTAFSSSHLTLRRRSSHHRRRRHLSNSSWSICRRGSRTPTCLLSFLPLLPSAAARGVTMCPCLPHPTHSFSQLLLS